MFASSFRGYRIALKIDPLLSESREQYKYFECRVANLFLYTL